MSSTAAATAGASSASASRKRSSRACDGCKQRRMKCEDISPSETTGEPTCKLCREADVECTFETPVRKRGPAPGFRRRTAGSRSPGRKIEDSDEEGDSDARPHHAGNSHMDGGERVHGTAGAAGRLQSPNRSIQPARRRRPPLLGLPPTLVDELLAVYFTHVHNVWPLIYKPMFNPHSTSAPLLLSMLAIAACLERTSSVRDGLDADKLFAMAETSLHHCRNDSRIDILQALMILSLRQTGCGDKRSAFAYAGRASCMALNLGLHMASTTAMETGETELRARVYWNAYVLDKILAEETGRPFLLPYRRSSTPLPSVTEADEYETWPPQTGSSVPLPRAVRHVVPRRGYLMTYFVWTIRLAMIVEDILDLDYTGPPPADPWDQQFTSAWQIRHDTIRRAETIMEQLDLWRAGMPPHIDVDLGSISPLPHHVIGLSWWHTAKILLHSRFIKRYPQTANYPELSANARRSCTEACEAVIELFSQLDRHRLLGQVSSDVIHMLSIITLFVAFDTSDSDEEVAHRARVNFAQCCIWLRDFSSSWPAASAHKVFFEALIQGGLKLSSGELAAGPSELPDKGVGISPASDMSPAVANSPSIPESLRAMGRHLAGSSGSAPPTPAQRPMGPPTRTGGGSGSGTANAAGVAGASTSSGPVPSLFQLPQFYWNHLMSNPSGEPGAATASSGADTSPPEGGGVTGRASDPMPWEWDLGDMVGVPATTGAAPAAGGGGSADMSLPQNGWATGGALDTNGQAQGMGGVPFAMSGAGVGTGGAGGEWSQDPAFMSTGAADQAAIHAAFLQYMLEAAKGGG